MKLIMLEDGEKYAVRGKTLVPEFNNYPPDLQKEYLEYGDGKYTMGESFKNAPASFKKFSIRRWNQLKQEKSYDR